LREYLHGNGVSTVINYPVALPFLPAYRHLGHTTSDFENAHRHQETVLSIPIYPEIDQSQQDFIIEVINKF